MICDELHIYKFELVPQKAKIRKLGRGKGTQPPEEDTHDQIVPEKGPTIPVETMIEKMFEISSFKAQKTEYGTDEQFSSILLQCRKLTLEKVSDATLAMCAELFLKKR